jgi:hypothetical protein
MNCDRSADAVIEVETVDVDVIQPIRFNEIRHHEPPIHRARPAPRGGAPFLSLVLVLGTLMLTLLIAIGAAVACVWLFVRGLIRWLRSLLR